MSTTAPTLRDAYRDWLKIPEGQLPPDHYALLGLPRFEGEPGKVQQATMARMKIVRPRCLKYHELGTQLLNQIAAANVCLTDTAAKAEYDKTLKSGGVTAAVQLASRAGAQERARLHQLLDEARKERQAGKPAETARSSTPGKPASPAAPKEEVFELTLEDTSDNGDFDLALADVDEDVIDDEIERLLAEYDLTAERAPRRPASPARSTVGESPFAAANDDDDDDDDWDDDNDARPMDSANSMSDQAQAILIACGLGVAAVILVGGFIAYAVSSSSSVTTSSNSSPPGSNSYIPSTPPAPSSPVAQASNGQPAGETASTPSPAAGQAGSTSPAAGFGGSPAGEPVPAELVSDVGPPSTAPAAAPAMPRLEYFTGTLTRIEQQADRVFLIVQVSHSSFEPPVKAEAGVPPPPGPYPAGVPGAGVGPYGYGGVDEPISSPTMIEAIVAEPGFAEKILDYRTQEEAVDELLASGRSFEFAAEGTPGVAAISETVVLTGRRRADVVPTRAAAAGGWSVELTAIEKANDPSTRAEIGKPRDRVPIDVHARRTPLHQLLRGFGTSRATKVKLTGTAQPTGVADAYYFRPTLSEQAVTLNAAGLVESELSSGEGKRKSRSKLSASEQLEILNLGVPVELMVDSQVQFDETGLPTLSVIAVRAVEQPALAGGPGGVGPGPQGAGFPGNPDGAFPGAPGVAAGAGLPAAGPDEKWYIVRVYDKFNKTNSYEVVHGLDARKQTIEIYRAMGVTASAEVGAFKTEEAANARLEVLQNKNARRTKGGFP